MLKKLTFSLTLLTLFSCSSQNIRKIASDMPQPQVADSLRPYLRQLPHAVYMYNYVARKKTRIGDSTTLSGSEPEVSAYLKTSISIYGTAANDSFKDAPGLYLSDDPFSSRHLGGADDWLMFRVELPAGHRYVDLRALHADPQANSIPLPLRSKLTEAGCPSQDYFVNLLRKSNTLACRGIALKALRELGADSFFYDWSWVVFKGCPHPSKAAAILINSDLITASSVQGFSKEIPPSDPAHSERLTLEALRLDISKDTATPSGALTDNDKKPFWPELTTDASALKDLAGWEREHLLGCD